MSWTVTFPTLSEEMVQEFESQATPTERAQLDEWFEVKRVINARTQPRHVVTCSLFWKNANKCDRELPQPTRKLLKRARSKGLVKRFEPWRHYIEPLLSGARLILAEREDLAVRVYLAADLEFLVEDLAAAGCEVRLMRSSSIRHNPGAMWRFLAFEDKNRIITCCDSDRLPSVFPDVARSEASAKTGVGMWRVPVWGDLNPEGVVTYRPIFGGQFGGRLMLPMRQLLKAFVWHSLKGTISANCEIPACGTRPIKGAAWPDYGFDEYFLIATLYPRAARKGVLSFVPSNARSQLLLLDIEYVTWANPRSEVVYFGAAQCCPRPAEADLAAHGIKQSETGLLQIKDSELVMTEHLTQRHPLPASARRAHPQRKDIDGSVWAWFNPASVEWRGKRWIVYRTECSPRWIWTRLNLARLDRAGRVIPGSNRLLRLPTQFGIWGAEDPRLTVWQDRLLLTYNDGSKMGLAEIREDGTICSARLFKTGQPTHRLMHYGDRREKNWGLFGAGSELFVSYWISPHIVYRCDEVKMQLTDHWESAWSSPPDIGELHGGSAPVEHGGLMWRVVHSRLPVRGRGTERYHLWLLAFSHRPPFSVRWWCQKPLLVGNREEEPHPEQVRNEVVFCGSLERVDGGWRIFFGENDCRIRFVVVPDEMITPHLIKVSP